MSKETVSYQLVDGTGIYRRTVFGEVSRRSVLSKITTGLGVSNFFSFLATGQKMPTPQDLPPSLKGEVLYRDVVKWSEFPGHQTGSDGDLATGDWIAERLKSAGLDVEFQNYSFPLFSLEQSSLKVAGHAVECFPAWIPAATGTTPVSGSLVSFSSDAAAVDRYADKIVLFPAAEVQKPGFFFNAMKVVQGGATSLILITPHPAGVVTALNSGPPYNRQPQPRPTLLVGAQDFEWLEKAASTGQTATVQITGEFRPQGKARNVIARVNRRNNRWIVVSTPASGWFRCAGERGSGVAVFLGLAQWAASLKTDCNWLFCATSGHELGHAGMLHLLESGALPEPKMTNCFLSLGASVTAREWERVEKSWRPLDRLSRDLQLVSTVNLADVVRPAFASILQVKATDQPEGGELRHVMSKGYAAIGLFGAHFWFHTKKDGLETTDAALMELVSRSLVKSLEGSLMRNA
jgi:hypothetical protein